MRALVSIVLCVTLIAGSSGRSTRRELATDPLIGGAIGVVCATALAKFLKSPLPVSTRPSNPRVEPITYERYKYLANKKIGDYFYRPQPDDATLGISLVVDAGTMGQSGTKVAAKAFEPILTPQGKAQLVKDLTEVATYFEHMHTEKGKLRNGDAAIDNVTQAVDALARHGAMGAVADQSLREFFLNEHTEMSPPPAWKKPLLTTLKAGAVGTLVAAPSFGVHAIWEQVKWNAKQIGYETTDFVNTPIRNSLSQATNTHMGFVGVKISLTISQIKEALFYRDEMLAAADAMDAAADAMEAMAKKNHGVDTKYVFNGMTMAQAKEMWRKGEEMFLKARQEMNSRLPDNTAVGRGYWATAVVFNPLTIEGAKSAARAVVLLHENRISDLNYRKKIEGALSPEDQELYETSKVELEIAKRTFGTVLALTRVYRFFYPEHDRPLNLAEEPFAGQFTATMEGLGMEYYSKAYVRELREQTRAIGMHLSGEAPDAFVDRQKQMIKVFESTVGSK